MEQFASSTNYCGNSPQQDAHHYPTPLETQGSIAAIRVARAGPLPPSKSAPVVAVVIILGRNVATFSSDAFLSSVVVHVELDTRHNLSTQVVFSSMDKVGVLIRVVAVLEKSLLSPVLPVPTPILVHDAVAHVAAQG